ncbi:MAG: SIR2 family protein [Methylobacter sp.]
MLSSDRETYAALAALTAIAESGARPIVFWIGAGASAWAGYPLWQELASQMHTRFSREATNYDRSEATIELTEDRFSDLFERMRLSDRPLYFKMLVQTFTPLPTKPIYSRMVRALQLNEPLHILTTNVDEVLEHQLTDAITVQNSDIERISTLLQDRRSFICKLHGTSSAVETMVFTKTDYERLIKHDAYLVALRELFSKATVIFLGYSLRDDYLIQLLLESDTQKPLFGTGPHFLVTANDSPHIPPVVRRIRYDAGFADHRDALQVLEAAAHAHVSARDKAAVPHSAPAELTRTPKSVYYIADLLPFGNVQTSQTMTIERLNGDAYQMVVGEGYIQGEVSIENYSALHDLMVGLICFDTVCFAVDRLSTVHDLLGADAFWEFLRLHAIRVVNVPVQSSVIFENEHSVIGSLGDFSLGSATSDLEAFSKVGNDELIRKHLVPVSDKEKEAEESFKFLAANIFDVSTPQVTIGLADKTRGALMHPSIRQLLGISGGTPHGTVPKWLTFPILRLARVMATGVVCQAIEASATRMIWGSERLATAAFSAAAGKNWADDAASYVLTGRYNSDIGAIVANNPALLHRLMEFRMSQQGEAFRREIADMLQTDAGAQVAAAVNSGLREAFPPSVLEQARNQFSGLFVPTDHRQELIPAYWGNLQNGDTRIAAWRKRSRRMLDEECIKRRLGPYSLCPCGSGEQLKFCCLAALT